MSLSLWIFHRYKQARICEEKTKSPMCYHKFTCMHNTNTKWFYNFFGMHCLLCNNLHLTVMLQCRLVGWCVRVWVYTMHVFYLQVRTALGWILSGNTVTLQFTYVSSHSCFSIAQNFQAFFCVSMQWPQLMCTVNFVTTSRCWSHSMNCVWNKICELYSLNIAI